MKWLRWEWKPSGYGLKRVGRCPFLRQKILPSYSPDTNIPSELTRPSPNARVVAFLKDAGREQVCLSVLTLGEMREGVAALPAVNRRKLLEEGYDTEFPSLSWLASSPGAALRGIRRVVADIVADTQ